VAAAAGGEAAAAAPSSSSGAAGGAASSDALLDLLASKIDFLEGSQPLAADESALTPSELSAVTARFAALRESLAAEREEGKSPVDQLAALLDLYRSEVQSRTVSVRLLSDAREKLSRAAVQKRSLEGLCRELQERNKKMSAEIRQLSGEQQRNHQEMKDKFEANLADIQLQLNKHSADRLSQQKENEKLRENLASLLKFDAMREEHHAQQIKTKELEARLAEAKLAQQADFAAAEARKALDAEAKIHALKALESSLRGQLAGYAEKFNAVQTTLTKSNELFTNFKLEMDKSAAAIKKSEKDKQALSDKYNAAQLNVIAMYEERQAERAEMEKLQRQNAVLTKLCKDLKGKAGASATATQQQQAAAEDTADGAAATEATPPQLQAANTDPPAS